MQEVHTRLIHCALTLQEVHTRLIHCALTLQEVHTRGLHADLLEQQTEHAEELVEIRLDAARNRLLTANLVLTLISTALSLMMVVTGVFGMNLPSGLETSADAFAVTLLASLLASAIVFVAGYAFMVQNTAT
jgi:magnesium transporter